MRVIPLVREGPRFVGGLLFVCQPIAAAAQELLDLVGIVQGELGGRRAAAVFVVAHDHPDAVEPNRVEGVFVGEIVADVDRQHAAGLVDLVADPGQRGALVPIDVGSQLDHLAAARHPQAMPLSVPVGCRDDLGHALRRDIAEVDGDGIALVLDARSRDVAELVAQFGRCTFQERVPRRPPRRCDGDCRRVRSARSRGCRHTRCRVSRPGRGCPPDHGHSVWPPGTDAARFSRAFAAPSTSVAASGSETISDRVPSKSRHTNGWRPATTPIS